MKKRVIAQGLVLAIALLGMVTSAQAVVVAPEYIGYILPMTTTLSAEVSHDSTIELSDEAYFALMVHYITHERTAYAALKDEHVWEYIPLGRQSMTNL